MFALRRILDITINIPTILICFAIIKLPLFKKYKFHLLATWVDPEKRSRADKLLYRVLISIWTNFEYLKESNPDKRESLKSLVMGGESGKKWADIYLNDPIDINEKYGNMTLKEACLVYEEVKTTLSNMNQKCVIIQIGSSSGREITYFAKMFPQHEFIGTDIYDSVVNYANSNNKLKNVSYVKNAAKDIDKLLDTLFNRSANQNFLVFSTGSLQYVQPEHLPIFFKSLNKFPNVSVLLTEPGNQSKGMPDNLKTSIYRGNFTYTHDYKWYAEESGIETVKSKMTIPHYPYEDFGPDHLGLVLYFYYGRT
jgi:trans-aconitate methyltransferase